MLQQTQVHRVLTMYPVFLRTFPTLSSLARTGRRDVVLAWRGMGYNTRAVRLHRLAQEIMHHHKGRLPADEQMLRLLPGIGKYTARALCVSAFRKRTAAVDVNARRVLSRVFWKMLSTGQLQSENSVWSLADRLVSERHAYGWNQAIMDLGATVCISRRPRCTVCPVSGLCLSKGHMKTPKRPITHREPSRDGIPNRIYRGRIVEILRHTRGVMTLPEIGKSVHAHFSGKHHRWLELLVTALEKDGLVNTRGNGSFRNRRVSLA
jgi:A/G-specific adenine glycosylase